LLVRITMTRVQELRQPVPGLEGDVLPRLVTAQAEGL
jgi:hypothetical protein